MIFSGSRKEREFLEGLIREMRDREAEAWRKLEARLRKETDWGDHEKRAGGEVVTRA